jgi:hypothetical protein
MICSSQYIFELNVIAALELGIVMKSSLSFQMLVFLPDFSLKLQLLVLYE